MISGIGRLWLPALSVLLVSTACTARDKLTEPAAPDLPVAVYAASLREGAPVYRLRKQGSTILVTASRSGKMRKLGHDHVIASLDVQGLVSVADGFAGSRADLQLPLKNLVVDNPEYRAAMGLDTELSESAVAGTYRNMQEKVLESDLYPWAQVRAVVVSGDPDNPLLDVSVKLHGVTFGYSVPVALAIAEDSLSVSGRMRIKQGDFGMEPYSALGGLLRVADELELEFSLVADRVDEIPSH